MTFAMNSELKHAFNNEMILAKTSYAKTDYTSAFYHLERAHILGQSYIIAHTYSHWWMCKIGFKTHNAKEIIGQFARMAASIVFRVFGSHSVTLAAPMLALSKQCLFLMT